MTTATNLPPHSDEAEEAVLACCLVSSEAAATALDRLEPASFYHLGRQLIFRGMAKCFARGELDAISLWETIKPDAGEVGVNYGYLLELPSTIPTVRHLPHFMRLVEELAQRRKVIEAGHKIVRLAHDAEEGQDVSADALGVVMATQDGKKGDALVDAPQLSDEFLDELQQAYDSKGVVGTRIVETGLYDLDQALTMSAEGDLIILAARPAMGKTALALAMARYVAAQPGQHVLIHSLEMGRKQLWQRLISMETGIEVNRLRRGMITEAEWGMVAEASATLAELNLTIDDRPAIKVGNVMAAAKRQTARGRKPTMIMVDYLQIMSADDSRLNSSNRVQALGQISGGLKQTAREVGCVVIALSQLSRAVESRTDKRPMLSDLRESGSLEQDADSVCFIYRDDYYAEQEGRDSDKPGTAEVIIAKHRSGPTGKVDLFFDRARTRFSNVLYQAPAGQSWTL